MKTKFIALGFIVAGVCTMSCRQDDESLTEETFQSSLKEKLPIESQRNANDSLSLENLETDPPRDGAHWKVDEVIDSKKNDSILLSLSQSELENGPKDPPRDSSHWKEGK